MKSVASQSFQDFEYIVIDGVSTDNSVEVVRIHELEFNYLSWFSEPDKGDCTIQE